MTTYAFDQPVTLRFSTFSDAAQTVPADPTTVEIDILAPDGTETSFTWAAGQVVRDSLGVFHFAFTPTQAGRHAFHWKAAGAIATSANGSFDVLAKYTTELVSLADAKAHLNIPTTTYDDELQGFIDAATDTVEGVVGPVGAVSYTDAFVTDSTALWPYHNGTWPRYTYGGTRAVDLRTQPVLAVQTVSVSSMDGTNAVTLATSSYRVDSVAGTLTLIDGSAFGPLVTVTYTAGRAVVPAAVRLATLLLVEHLWDRSQYPSSQFGAPANADLEVDLASSLGPSKETQAMMLLDRYRLTPAIG